MDADKIAERVEAERARQGGQRRSEDERARRQYERVLATGSRVEVVEDADGAELRIRPRPFLVALNGVERAGLVVLLPFLVPLPVLLAVVVPRAPDHAWLVAVPAAYLLLLGLAVRWFLGTPPLRPRVTPRGHVALWHRRTHPRKPTWVGPISAVEIRFHTFGRRHWKSGFWERRFGWTEMNILIEGRLARDAGPAYALHAQDLATVQRFLGRHRVEWR